MKDNWGNVSQKQKILVFNVNRSLHVAYVLFDIEAYVGIILQITDVRLEKCILAFIYYFI